ncbi:thioesterase family protein [Sphaerothrix gracilis]|uniref:acyl-CoA thioesterase n=1 Tax=Sphaerothrix gracilis TaxID=3151835 RepID=UPI0031FC51BA
MAFCYGRTVRFGETDAAGVVYFANLLHLCHEAYEASLAEMGFDLKTFFSAGAIAVPIVHAEANFYQPLFCGDRLTITLAPEPMTESSFAITYEIWPHEPEAGDRPAVTALTRHVCIEIASRQRQALSAELQRWLDQFAG